ncbi:MAG: GNAT family N-acetyltransferase [Chloroflexi bacterium RBG_19FT_COMBO_50_10]|nr:MAG: GNAT family N-acetyltransferase [Chloroflexi bacterium RBG_19FT_COMBO_50_10]
MMEVQPIILVGKVVRLEPLSESHVPELTISGQDESIWHYMLYNTIRTEQQMRSWVLNLLAQQAKGTDLPFAVIHLESGRVIGATRYLNIRPQDRGLEIGGTWYAVKFQRTAVNTECKYLLLKHAFEGLKCIRVQFKTDLRNERSQRALERIGAVKEGILRSHMITPDGYIRDSVFYSILASEWPLVRARLEEIIETN